MTNKPLILAFSLAAGLMSSTAMAADFSATSSMSREVTPIMINGMRDLAIWDNNGSVADHKETVGQLAADKVDTFGRIAPTRVDATLDAGSALVATILAETKSDKADLVRPALADGLTVPRTDKYDITAVATVAMAAPLTKVDTTRVDAIKYAEFDRADTVAANKPAVAVETLVVATRADAVKSDKVDSSKNTTAVADSRVTTTAIKEIKSAEVAVVVDQSSSKVDSIRVATLSRGDTLASATTLVTGTRTDAASDIKDSVRDNVKDNVSIDPKTEAALLEIRKQAEEIQLKIAELQQLEKEKGGDYTKQLESLTSELAALKDKASSYQSGSLIRDTDMSYENVGTRDSNLVKDGAIKDGVNVSTGTRLDTKITSDVFSNVLGRTEKLGFNTQDQINNVAESTREADQKAEETMKLLR